MKQILVAFCFTIAGCSTVAPYVTPALTLDLCDAVDYQRRGLDVTITAKCKAPVK